MSRLLIIFLSLLLVFCTRAPRNLQKTTQNIPSDIKRTPGEKLIEPPNTVRSTYNCDSKKLPFVSLEENELYPTTIYAGQEFNHHLVYVMCSKRSARVIKGNLYRIIYSQGQVVFEDISRNFELKPGKWSVDAFIKAPKAGVYSMQTVFKSKAVSFEKNSSLTVK